MDFKFVDHPQHSFAQDFDSTSNGAVIKVIGVGGGGCNTIRHMASHIHNVEFICVNTDVQSLDASSVHQVIQIGAALTKGLGAGANPEIGRQAANEDSEALRSVLQGSDMVFITAGMGGGTGTGAAPVIAQMAREMGILTVAVVTKPFPFEGKRRAKVAEAGISALKQYVDSLIIIPNEKLLSALERHISLLEAFSAANDVLLGAVQGISELITRPGLINVDFADVKTVMSEMGNAMMGSGVGFGDHRAHDAAQKAIRSPLLDNLDLTGAKGVLVNITAGPSLSITEFQEVGEAVRAFTSDDAIVIVGTVIDPALKDEHGLRVTLVATGLASGHEAVITEPKPADIVSAPIESVVSQPATPKDSPKAAQQQPEYFDIPLFLRRKGA